MRRLAVILVALLFVGSVECSISEIKVVPGEEVSIPFTVKNDGEAKRIPLSYHFFGTDVEGYFYYGGIRVTSIWLNSSESAEVSFKFIAPEKEGDYYLTLYGDGSKGIRVVVEEPKKAMKITPDFTGVVVEAGDIVEMNVNLENILGSPIEVDLACNAPESWECSFYDGDIQVNRVVVENSKQLRVRVDTDSSSVVGKYEVKLQFNDQSEKVDFFVKESHAGEMGEVRLRAVDRDGAGVSSARIVVIGYGNNNTSSFYTSGDGEAIFEVEPGVYDIRIEKGGYFEKIIRDVKVKGGRTNDLGTIFLEKKAYYAEIVLSSSRVTATIGEVTGLRVKIENRGYGEDSYSLILEGLPDDFTYNFKSENLAISEITLEGGESKDLNLEIYIPPNAEVGEYAAKIVAKGRYEAVQNLTINVVGHVSVEFSLEGGMYTVTATQGEELKLKGFVFNSGRGVTLTNLKVNLDLPEGWDGSVEPDIIPSLKSGRQEYVDLEIKIPQDAKPSEYRIAVEIASDQTKVADRISVVVRESSFATYIGLGIIVLALMLLLILVKKVGRR